MQSQPQQQFDPREEQKEAVEGQLSPQVPSTPANVEMADESSVKPEKHSGKRAAGTARSRKIQEAARAQ